MKVNSKIVAVKIQNIKLRQLLLETALESSYKRDVSFTNESHCNNASYELFVLNDSRNQGYGFARYSDTYNIISIEAMIDILTNAKFEPVIITLNEKYSAEIQADGSVKVGSQIFSKESICNLLFEIERVTSKNI